MNKEMKRIIEKFFFASGVTGCLILLVCGCITASQRSAYNAYLTEYSVISMKNEGRRLTVSGGGEELAVKLPEAEMLEKVRRYLKFSPFASLVFFAESTEKLMESFSD